MALKVNTNNNHLDCMLKPQIYLCLSGDMKTIFGTVNKTHSVKIKNQSYSWED